MYVKVPSDKYEAEVQPSAQDHAGLFKANLATYTCPEKALATWPCWWPMKKTKLE